MMQIRFDLNPVQRRFHSSQQRARLPRMPFRMIVSCGLCRHCRDPKDKTQSIFMAPTESSLLEDQRQEAPAPPKGRVLIKHRIDAILVGPRHCLLAFHLYRLKFSCCSFFRKKLRRKVWLDAGVRIEKTEMTGRHGRCTGWATSFCMVGSHVLCLFHIRLL